KGRVVLRIEGKDALMKTRLLWCFALASLMLCLGARQEAAQKTEGRGGGGGGDDEKPAPKRKTYPKEEEALVKQAEAFVAAFHKGDAKAVAAFWMADGDYTDQTGKQMKGRAAIEKAFKEFFAENKGLKLRIDILSLRFVTPDVAFEEGTTEV